jgi:Ice-binding-like
MKRTYFRLLGAFVGFAAFLFGPFPALAQVAPTLGKVQQFTVLGGSKVVGSAGVGTGTTVTDGDVGSAPTPAVTNFLPIAFGCCSTVTPPFMVHGQDGVVDAITAQAHLDAITAYDFLKAQGSGTPRASNLTGQTFLSGIYSFVGGFADLPASASMTLSGGPADIFIFQMDSTLTANVLSTVKLVGGVNPCNVYWRVGSSATLNGSSGVGESFPGNVFALASITVGVGANVKGRVIAGSGAAGAGGVTMAGGPNTIGGCASLVIPCVNFTLSPLPNGTIGIPYSQQITPNAGTPPYKFAVSSGTLPVGLTLSATGLLSGTPTTAGTFTSFTITATDKDGCFGSVSSLVIGCPVITLTPATLPPITVGAAYSQTIAVVGGPGPYDFATTGTLPAGLGLTGATDTSVKITGTPTTAGPFNFQITAAQRSDHSCFATITYATFAVPPVGGPTLDFVGLAILIMLLTGVGVLLVNRFTL